MVAPPYLRDSLIEFRMSPKIRTKEEIIPPGRIHRDAIEISTQYNTELIRVSTTNRNLDLNYGIATPAPTAGAIGKQEDLATEILEQTEWADKPNKVLGLIPRFLEGETKRAVGFSLKFVLCRVGSKHQQIRDKATMAVLWGKRVKQTENQENAPNVFGEQITGIKDKRGKLLEFFRAGHGFPPQSENQPSEQAIGLLVKLQGRKSAESPQLSRVANYAEGRCIKVEHARIKAAPFLMEDGTMSLTAVNRYFLLPAESFCQEIRVLMHGYSVASTNDDPGNEWATYEAATSHLATVENVYRANSEVAHRMRSQVMEAEAAARAALAKLSQNRPELNLSEIIEISARRRDIWPLASEFA